MRGVSSACVEDMLPGDKSSLPHFEDMRRVPWLQRTAQSDFLPLFEDNEGKGSGGRKGDEEEEAEEEEDKEEEGEDEEQRTEVVNYSQIRPLGRPDAAAPRHAFGFDPVKSGW